MRWYLGISLLYSRQGFQDLFRVSRVRFQGLQKDLTARATNVWGTAPDGMLLEGKVCEKQNVDTRVLPTDGNGNYVEEKE